jgi:ribosomal protein S1
VDGDWIFLENQAANNNTVRGRVLELCKGGFRVGVFGIKGFVPESQLRLKGTLPEELIDTEIPLKILEIDAKRNKLILSHRLVVQEEQAAQRAQALRTLRAGQMIDGQVVRIADFGAFLDLGALEGLLPISEISSTRVSHPSEMVRVGQVITTRVLKIDPVKGYVTLSLKQATSQTIDGCEHH